jgi:hypothetical protein
MAGVFVRTGQAFDDEGDKPRGAEPESDGAKTVD